MLEKQFKPSIGHFNARTSELFVAVAECKTSSLLNLFFEWKARFVMRLHCIMRTCLLFHLMFKWLPDDSIFCPAFAFYAECNARMLVFILPRGSTVRTFLLLFNLDFHLYTAINYQLPFCLSEWNLFHRRKVKVSFDWLHPSCAED